MKNLLIATSNKAKLQELVYGIKSELKNRVHILSLAELKIKVAPEETGETFKENAKLKAKFYADLTGFQTIADDGGLIIPYLNNEPGVKSRRWPGYHASDDELIKYTLLHLKGVKGKNRAAFLEVCLCFYDPKTKRAFFEQEKIKGHIAEKPTGRPTGGYPYRALFVVDKFNKLRLNQSKYYDELTEEEHKKVNHRLKALKRLIKKIEKYLIE